MSKKDKKIRVGISIGDVNGISLEIIIKALSDNRILELFTPVIYGSGKVLTYHKKAINEKNFHFLSMKSADDVKDKKVNLINLWDEEVNITLGNPSQEGGKYAIKSLDAATKDLASTKIDVLVTAPIDKDSIQNAGFDFPGHTEYLAKMSNVKEALMMMVSDQLRVALVTSHIPLDQVAEHITTGKIEQKIGQVHQSLQKDFGIRDPKIAVMGLNPHAGEKGKIGDQEQKIIAPAIQSAKKSGKTVFGPYPADGFFGSSNIKKFDGVLAMYHDQGLGPFKALAFDSGVNFTAGLPIVRTSPDHGTAYDITGKGKASETSFRNAMYLAVDIYKTRKQEKEINANPLKPQSKDSNNKKSNSGDA